MNCLSNMTGFFKAAVTCSKFLPSKFHEFFALQLARIHARGKIKQEVYPDVFLNLDLGDWLQRLYFAGLVEKTRLDLIRKLVPSNGVFVDIGANVGLYTCVMAKHMTPDGSVIAFEPMPECLEQLQENIRLNELKNVEVHSFALTNQERVFDLYLPKIHPGGPSGATQVWDPGHWKIVGRAVGKTLDSVYQKEALDFIKIDVQGHEIQVLEGAKKVIERFRPMILCEVSYQSRQDFFQLAKEWNYKIYVESPPGQLSHSLPTRDGHCDFFLTKS